MKENSLENLLAENKLNGGGNNVRKTRAGINLKRT